MARLCDPVGEKGKWDSNDRWITSVFTPLFTIMPKAPKIGLDTQMKMRYAFT